VARLSQRRARDDSVAAWRSSIFLQDRIDARDRTLRRIGSGLRAGIDGNATMSKRQDLGRRPANVDAAGTAASAVLDVIGHVPRSTYRKSRTPEAEARQVANAAAARAAIAAGALALPPGPLGWLTIAPELMAVWRIQAQMVADIAALYGKSASLTREQMLYCLFRHTAAQAVRDLVVRVGERVLVRQASLDALQRIAERVGLRLSQRALGAGVSRWVPILGAVGVGGYVYYDTAQIANSACDLFWRDLDVDDSVVESHDPGSESSQ
jgi:hypothetical protein